MSPQQPLIATLSPLYPDTHTRAWIEYSALKTIYFLCSVTKHLCTHLPKHSRREQSWIGYLVDTFPHFKRQSLPSPSHILVFVDDATLQTMRTVSFHFESSTEDFYYFQCFGSPCKRWRLSCFYSTVKNSVLFGHFLRQSLNISSVITFLSILVASAVMTIVVLCDSFIVVDV